MRLELFNLHSKEDETWREWIRCKGKNLSKIFKEFCEKNRNFKFSKKITQKMKKDWKNGRSSIPIWVLKEICEKNPELEESVKNEIEFLKLFGSNEIRAPHVLTEVLAEIIGRHCGDGSCNLNNSDFKISLKEDPSLIEIHKQELNEIFGIEPRIVTISESCKEVVFRSKIFARILTNIFNLPGGKEKTFHAKEPEIIKTSGLKFRKAFLRGLIDTDGCISRWDNSVRLSFDVVNENLASAAFDILQQLKFSPKFSKDKNGVFHVKLTNKKDISRFLKEVGSKNLRILSKFEVHNPGNRCAC